MRVCDVMSNRVRTIEATESLEAAAHTMQRYRIRHLVVLDGGEVAGVLSKSDLGNLDRAALAGTRVADRMADEVVTIDEQASLRAAANLLRGRTIGCLPVLGADDRCVGIITTSDLLEVLGRGAAHPEATTRGRTSLARRAPRRPRPTNDAR